MMKMKMTAVIMTVVLLLGMFSAVALPGMGFTAKAATAPAFSVNLISETSSEVTLSLNLESGSIKAMDWQINADDWNSSEKTTGLTLENVEYGQGYITFCESLFDTVFSPVCVLNKNTGQGGFSSVAAYNVLNKPMFVYTFSKSSMAKQNVEPSDFLVLIDSCSDANSALVVPSITFNWESSCKHTEMTHSVVEATCSSQGYTLHSCTNCSYSYKSDYTAKLPHKFGDWTIVNPPTGTTPETAKRICSVCGEIQSKGTTLFSVNLISETSSEVTLSFNLESGSITAMDWQINAADWNSSEKTTGLTLENVEYGQGFKTYYESAIRTDYVLCSVNRNNGRGGYVSLVTYNLSEPMFIYTFSKSSMAKQNVEPSDFLALIDSCSDASGESVAPSITFNWESSCKHTEMTHSVVEATCSSQGYTLHSCTNCSYSYKSDYTAKLPHKFDDWSIVEAPTDTANGTGERTCSVCGASESIELAYKEDKESKVQLMFPYKPNTTIVVKDETQTIGNLIQDGLKTHKLYDITMLKDNQPIQPDGTVTVRIPVPNNFDRSRARVYHIKSRNPIVREEIPSDIDGDFIVFKTNHFSYFEIAEELGKVNSVSVSDITLNYKKSAPLNPTIKADEGAEYTVKYTSSNPSVARVDENGNVYAAKKGSATITCTVTDSDGSTFTDACNVTVKYSFGQWLIKIILFGWIWY